jgi:hypothetical protein
LDRRLGGPHSQAGCGEKKNSHLPPGIKPLKPYSPAYSQSLYQLSYPGSYNNEINVVVPLKQPYNLYMDAFEGNKLITALE